MNRGEQPPDREIPLHECGWDLLRFLVSIGADEFNLRLICTEPIAGADRFESALALFSSGMKERERTVRYRGESGRQAVPVWQLNSESITALASIMPAGIFGPSRARDAWVEDLCVFRGGKLVFGTVTHEQYAFVRLSDEEWSRWQGVE